MKIIFTALLLLMASIGTAQQKHTYFLKNNGKYVATRDSADFVRTVQGPDPSSAMYSVTDYFLNGQIRLTGWSNTTEPTRFEGECVRYYLNGNKQRVANYKGGVLTGEDHEFYPNGKAYLLKEYPDNTGQTYDMSINFIVKAEYDSLGAVLVDNGDGY